MLHNLFNDGSDDIIICTEEVIATHPRLARKTRSHHHDIAIGRGTVIARVCRDTDGARVAACGWCGFGHVEPLARGDAIENVGDNDVGQVRIYDALRGGGTDESCTDNSDLAAHSVSLLIEL